MTRPARMEAQIAWALVLPAGLLLSVFVLVPSLIVAAMSFTDYSLAAPALHVVGLDNYAEMLADPLVWNALRNTLVYALVMVLGASGLGLGVALLVARMHRLGGFYRLAYFLPAASTMMAMATVWEYLLHPSVGPVNQLIALLGVGKVGFLSGTGSALLTLAGIGIWQSTGFNMVLFLAGLSAIPRDLYHAAAVDGADTAWDRFCLVTWPMLTPTTLFVVVVTSIQALRVFDTVALLTQGGPARSTDVMMYRIYLQAFQNLRMGYAAALTVTFLGLVAALAVAQTALAGRRRAA
jgi:multiple sugar transport system permease protein